MTEKLEKKETASHLFAISSKDFFLSAIVNDEDLEAGRPEFQPEALVNSGLALLFLQDSNMFLLLIASTLSFFKIRGLVSVDEASDEDS